MLLLETPSADRHGPLEDVFGILVGVTLVALAVAFLRSAGLFTGQIAGLALVISYPTGFLFGALFLALNMPFYWLAVKQLGWGLAVKSFLAVIAMSTLAEVIPRVVTIQPNHPVVAALLAGVLAGLGLLALFRHGATLGGVGMVALWLQDTRGIKAGTVQLGFDLCVFALALFLFEWSVVFYSLVGAIVINLMIIVNHRRDRYIARS